MVVLGRAAGLFGTGSSGAADSSKAEAKQESAADGLATVPDLVGKTEEEAKTLANDAHLGVQMAGEEASDQEKAGISRQETARERQVEANTTVKYWVSTGTARGYDPGSGWTHRNRCTADSGRSWTSGKCPERIQRHRMTTDMHW